MLMELLNVRNLLPAGKTSKICMLKILRSWKSLVSLTISPILVSLSENLVFFYVNIFLASQDMVSQQIKPIADISADQASSSASTSALPQRKPLYTQFEDIFNDPTADRTKKVKDIVGLAAWAEYTGEADDEIEEVDVHGNPIISVIVFFIFHKPILIFISFRDLIMRKLQNQHSLGDL